jgi:hypothetical protein
MKADLRERLASVARGEITRKHPVTRVEGVTGIPGYTSKSLMLPRYPGYTSKTGSCQNDAKDRVTEGVTAPPEPEDTALEERKGLPMGSAPQSKPAAVPWPEPTINGTPPFGSDEVPDRYEAEWKALLARCPPWATEWQWTAAIFDSRNLFGEWGAELLRLDWQPSAIFDRWQGLAWFLKGSPVTALGPRHAFLHDGRIFETRSNCPLGK